MPKLILYCQGEIIMHAYHFISFNNHLLNCYNVWGMSALTRDKKLVRIPFVEIKCNDNVGSKFRKPAILTYYQKNQKNLATVILYTKEDEKMQNTSQVWVPGEWKDCGVKMENWKKEMTWQNENEFSFRRVESENI